MPQVFADALLMEKWISAKKLHFGIFLL